MQIRHGRIGLASPTGWAANLVANIGGATLSSVLNGGLRFRHSAMRQEFQSALWYDTLPKEIHEHVVQSRVTDSTRPYPAIWAG